MGRKAIEIREYSKPLAKEVVEQRGFKVLDIKVMKRANEPNGDLGIYIVTFEEEEEEFDHGIRNNNPRFDDD